jgi:O-antigen/teichoic acid export membrane protein
VVSILRLLSAIIPFFITILISNILEPKDAGNFFAAYSLILFVSTLIRLGVDDQVLIMSSNQTQSIAVLLLKIRTLLIVPVILGISWVIIVISLKCFGFFNGKDFAQVIYILALIPLVTMFYTVIAIIFQGQGNYFISILGLSFLLPFTFILLLLFNLGELQLIEVTYYILIATLSNALVMTFILAIKLKGNKSKENKKIEFTRNKFKLNYALNSLVAVFFVQAPIFIAGFLLPSEDVTNVALASRLSQTLVLLLLVVNFTFGPDARRLFEKNMIHELILLWQKKVYLLWCAGFVVSLLFWTVIYDNALFIKYIKIDNLVLLILWLAQIISISFGPIGFLMIMSNQITALASIGITVVFFTLILLLITYQWLTVYLYCGIFLFAILCMKSLQTFLALNKLRTH